MKQLFVRKAVNCRPVILIALKIHYLSIPTTNNERLAVEVFRTLEHQLSAWNVVILS